MKNYMNRLEKVESELFGENKCVLLFVRQKSREEDFSKQLEEYRNLYGDMGETTFLSITHYANEEAEYSEFLEKCRRNSGGPFAWWPAFLTLPEKTEEKEITAATPPFEDNSNNCRQRVGM